jgi:hypothetical protein
LRFGPIADCATPAGSAGRVAVHGGWCGEQADCRPSGSWLHDGQPRCGLAVPLPALRALDRGPIPSGPPQLGVRGQLCARALIHLGRLGAAQVGDMIRTVDAVADRRHRRARYASGRRPTELEGRIRGRSSVTLPSARLTTLGINHMVQYLSRRERSHTTTKGYLS